MIWLDLETRSECDLKLHGAYNYAEHPTTEILCCCYAIDDGEVREGIPDFGDHQIRAHNAAFERLILNKTHNLPIERFYCTAAQARANAMPGSLEDVGRFTGSGMRKSRTGAALIRRMCVPPFQHTPELLAELTEYCAQDVRAMRSISKSMRPLSGEELADYHVNEHINDRGVLYDHELAVSAQRYAAEETTEIQARVRGATGIDSPRSPKLRGWVWDRVPDKSIMMVDDKVSLDKSVRAKLLASADVSSDVLDVVQMVDDLAMSSVSKFARMTELGQGGRIRGSFVFSGGPATGRASSYGLQVHNFSRACDDDPEVTAELMANGGPLPGVMKTLRGMLRPALIAAPGNNLIVADWSSIEARMNAWLSTNGEHVLDVYRAGEDLYVSEAAKLFPGLPITKALRQIGKVAVLACGYGGGANAFASMGRVYGVIVRDPQAKEMVRRWRDANQWAVKYWSDLETAYMGALRDPNVPKSAGRVHYMYDGAHLWCCLPSGRIICYPFARKKDGDIWYAKAAWKPSAAASEWPRAKLWKGLACENICQAAANDVLRHALRLIPDVVLHVHDEIVVECADDRTEGIRRAMCTPPKWAEGLPLEVSIKTMRRYGK